MEIETKIKTENLEEIKQKLIGLGASFNSKAVVQIDEYYKPKGREMETQKPGSFILRIRQQGKKVWFTLKGLTNVTGAWLEHETKVSSAKELAKILDVIGFAKIFTIHKERVYGKLNELEICLDKIKGLGNYVEFEVIADNAEESKKKIHELLKKLGVDESQIEHRGYAAIISQNMGIKFEGTQG